MLQIFLTNKTGALITILILAVGSISGVGAAQFVMADQVDKVCVIFACGNANITGGTSGGGGGGQPTPTISTLIVTKVCERLNGEEFPCPLVFKITVSGNNPSPASFPGSATGTSVSLGPGKYTVTESLGGNIA